VVKLPPPPFFLINFGSRKNLEKSFHLFLGVLNPHYGGSPKEKFVVVTLWRPLQQISVKNILNKFLNEKGIIISTNVKDQYGERYSDRYYVFQDSRVVADKKITDDKNPCRKSKWRP